MSRITITILALSLGLFTLADDKTDAVALHKATTFYASFDAEIKGDHGGGDLAPWTRKGDRRKGVFTYEKGIAGKGLSIAKGKGVSGGALDATEALPEFGRAYFPAKGNIAFDKKGWNGSVSMWIKTEPNKLIKEKFCDPVQITQKGANNGGLWFDFNDKLPNRDLRMGIFAAVPEGKKGAQESDKDAPMVWLRKVEMKAEDWYHVAMTWKNLDTGKANAHATLYINSKKIGDIKDKALAMEWDIEKTGIYFALGYIGLIDEFAVFNRELTAAEVKLLHDKPDVLAALKKK